MYPTCAIDWYSRYVVDWRLADDVGAAGVCSCVAEAFSGHGAPAPSVVSRKLVSVPRIWLTS